VFSFSETVNQVNASVEYFLRARKNGYPLSSSSSNLTNTLVTGYSINPNNTKISYVSNNPNNAIEIKVERNPISHYSEIDLYRINPDGATNLIKTFTGTESSFEDVGANNWEKHNYYILSKNMCGIVTDTSLYSNNIVVTLKEDGDQLRLNWDRYFTWNAGVKEYIIYTSSGSTVAEATNFVALTTVNSDTFYLETKGSLGAYCYYIHAIEQAGINSSLSNKVCYVKTGNIYYPNAIVPKGTNPVFNFVGDGIDLAKSKIQIYNRWGQLEFITENLTQGWDGRNNTGNEVPGDVYFFTAQISQGIETISIKGNITVLR
jgi:gliding motility-associated-like protein